MLFRQFDEIADADIVFLIVQFLQRMENELRMLFQLFDEVLRLFEELSCVMELFLFCKSRIFSDLL